MSYHVKYIPKGEYGELSKIIEEVAELQDAHEQDCMIMELCELADLIGAIEAYTVKHHNKTLNDLITFSRITKRAFESGHRTPKNN